MSAANAEAQPHAWREWLDRLAIQDLIYRYSDAVTRADWVRCEEVFAPDAIWESPILGMRYENRASFMEMLRATATYDLLIQTAHSSVITLSGANQAQATTTIHEFIREGEAGEQRNFEQYGIYFDDLARFEGGWRFIHRLFVPVYVGKGCVTGDLLSPRSALLRPD
jgi:ketosteroid isomerase-like protein